MDFTRLFDVFLDVLARHGPDLRHLLLREVGEQLPPGAESLEHLSLL